MMVQVYDQPVWGLGCINVLEEIIFFVIELMLFDVEHWGVDLSEIELVELHFFPQAAARVLQHVIYNS